MQNWKARFAPYAESMVPIRHQLHANPELAFEEFATSRLVAEKLTQWGYEVTTGIGGTGVVGTLRVGDSNRSIGLRADMDALPILEESGVPHASTVPGIMHACGHDGHTSILLGAAKYLAESPNFSGTLHLIFQPAEEGKAGAKKMMEDGLFDRFPCDEVYGLHNYPGLPVGAFKYRSGPTMASHDRMLVTIKGNGGHASEPSKARDPIVAASSIVGLLQTVVSRNVSPFDSAVVTVSAFHAGDAFNVIPQKAEIKLSIRTHRPDVREATNARAKELISMAAHTLGCEANVVAMPDAYPPLFNHFEQTETGRALAEELFGSDHPVEEMVPVMGSEDFAFMLEKVPGAYFFLGNGMEGANGAPLHNPAYDFNDDALLPGIAFWGELVGKVLPAQPDRSG